MVVVHGTLRAQRLAVLIGFLIHDARHVLQVARVERQREEAQAWTNRVLRTKGGRSGGSICPGKT